MNARKRVNKGHRDYPKYIEKCEALWAEYEPQRDAVEKAGREVHPNWRGMDSPWGDEERALMKKYHAELKKLQEEYAYLFTGDDGNES